MVPHPHLIHSNMVPRIRMRKKTACLILTDAEVKPKVENQHKNSIPMRMREFKRPHPHKENKTANTPVNYPTITKIKTQAIGRTTKLPLRTTDCNNFCNRPAIKSVP